MQQVNLINIATLLQTYINKTIIDKLPEPFNPEGRVAESIDRMWAHAYGMPLTPEPDSVMQVVEDFCTIVGAKSLDAFFLQPVISITDELAAKVNSALDRIRAVSAQTSELVKEIRTRSDFGSKPIPAEPDEHRFSVSTLKPTVSSFDENYVISAIHARSPKYEKITNSVDVNALRIFLIMMLKQVGSEMGQVQLSESDRNIITTKLQLKHGKHTSTKRYIEAALRSWSDCDAMMAFVTVNLLRAAEDRYQHMGHWKAMDKWMIAMEQLLNIGELPLTGAQSNQLSINSRFVSDAVKAMHYYSMCLRYKTFAEAIVLPDRTLNADLIEDMQFKNISESALDKFISHMCPKDVEKLYPTGMTLAFIEEKMPSVIAQIEDSVAQESLSFQKDIKSKIYNSFNMVVSAALCPTADGRPCVLDDRTQRRLTVTADKVSSGKIGIEMGITQLLLGMKEEDKFASVIARKFDERCVQMLEAGSTEISPSQSKLVLAGVVARLLTQALTSC